LNSVPTKWWLAVAFVFVVAGCDQPSTTSTGPATAAAGKQSGSGSKDDGSAAGNSSTTTADLTSLRGTVKVDGSSTVYLISEAVAEEFQNAAKGNVKVTLGILGTGGGFQKFNRGEIDVADASRPILAKEIEEARKNDIEYIELPIALDALTVVVNPDNKLDSIKVSELKTMWEPAAEGKISKWKEVNPEWPDAPLKLYGPGPSSGTFDYFTEAVVGKAKQSRSDYGANEDDNVIVQQIAGNKNALGYFGYAYYDANKKKLKALPVDDEKGGGPVLPSLASVNEGKYYLSRPLFIYVNKKSAQRPEVKAFVEYYLKRAAEFAEEVKYIPLPAGAYDVARERFSKLQAGSAFGGSHARVSADELMRLEVKQ
jgi:phosphate transport system substrate-binding protein